MGFLAELLLTLTVGSGNLYNFYDNVCLMPTSGYNKIVNGLDESIPVLNGLEKILESESLNSIDSFLQTRKRYEYFDGEKEREQFDRDLEKYKISEQAGGVLDKALALRLFNRTKAYFNHVLYHMGLERKKFLEGRITENEYKDRLVELFITLTYKDSVN